MGFVLRKEWKGYYVMDWKYVVLTASYLSSHEDPTLFLGQLFQLSTEKASI
jgi:hypothetical protein